MSNLARISLWTAAAWCPYRTFGGGRVYHKVSSPSVPYMAAWGRNIPPKGLLTACFFFLFLLKFKNSMKFDQIRPFENLKFYTLNFDAINSRNSIIFRFFKNFFTENVSSTWGISANLKRFRDLEAAEIFFFSGAVGRPLRLKHIKPILCEPVPVKKKVFCFDRILVNRVSPYWIKNETAWTEAP